MIKSSLSANGANLKSRIASSRKEGDDLGLIGFLNVCARSKLRSISMIQPTLVESD